MLIPSLCFGFFSGRFAIKLRVVWSWERLFPLNKQAGKRAEVQMKKNNERKGSFIPLVVCRGIHRNELSEPRLRVKCNLSDIRSPPYVYA